jgi:hypothetical protein
MLSNSFSNLSVLSLYSPFTGEILCNTEIPDYMKPFTLAHEYAHAIGATGEADANLLAYIALTQSEEPLLSYSSSLSMLQLVLPFLPQSFINDTISRLPLFAKENLNEYRDYKRNTASSLTAPSEKLNDAHLSLYGENAKYSYTVCLLASYINNLDSRYRIR